MVPQTPPNTEDVPPRPRVELPAAVREVVLAGHPAHLVTLDADGRPQVTLVWVGMDGDEIVSAHLRMRAKLRNVNRDPRVAISIETGGVDAHGLDEYLVIHGSAQVTAGGAPELLQQLAHRYLGAGVEFPPPGSRTPGYVLHIRPERVSGVGPWARP